MHIGFIEDTPLRGGTQIWVSEAVEDFIKKGHEVTVLCPANTWVAEKCAFLGARVRTYDWDGVCAKDDANKKIWIEALAPCDTAVTTVHPPRNDFHCVGFAGECIREGGLKTFLMPKTGSIVPWYKREYYIPEPSINHAVICITGFTRDYLISDYKISAEKVELIYQGTEVDRFTSDPKTKAEAMVRYKLPETAFPVLGSIGAIEDRKGQIILLQAMKKLIDSERLPNVYAMFVGEGPDEEMLKAVTKVYGLEDHVSFFPFTSEPNYVFERIDILAFPSLYKEGLPNVILEAMSMRLPVVSSRLAGIPEAVIHHETGYLTDPGNVEAFADGVEFLAESRETCTKLGDASRKLMEDKMDKTKQFDIFLDYFKKITGKV
jgi:glycosyltransferase involved in cell wall biosynthesis